MCARTYQNARQAFGVPAMAARLVVALDHLKVEALPLAGGRDYDRAALAAAIAEVETLITLLAPAVGAGLIDLERVEMLHALQAHTETVFQGVTT